MTQEFATLPREVVEQALAAMSLALSDVDWRKDSPTQPVIHKAYNATRRAALDQPQNHVTDAGNMAPTGWKLVPVEPTHDMVYAAREHHEGEPYLPHSLYSAMLAAAPQPPASKDPNWPKLEKPAQVGGGTFGIGTSSKYIVDAAQRAHDEQVRAGNLTHEQMVEEERKRRALWDMIHGSPEESKPQFVWQPQGEQEPVAWIEVSEGALSYNPYYAAARELQDGVRFDLYTHPQPKREPPTDEQIIDIADELQNSVDSLRSNIRPV